MTVMYTGVLQLPHKDYYWNISELFHLIILSSNALYNDLYYCIDEYQNQVLRWDSNNLVIMITESHKPDVFVEQTRRRARLTNTSKKHIEDVWGSESIKRIEIAVVIEDYNYHIVRVDLSDHRIVSYAAYLRCRRK